MQSVERGWSELAAENEAERLAHLGMAAPATSHRAADLTWVVTGLPTEEANGVIWTRLSPDAADAQVPALVEQFRFQGLPAVWRLDSATEPADMAARLEALGCEPVPPGVRMGAALADLAREMSRFPGLTVDRVESAEDLRAWFDIWSSITAEPPGPRIQFYSHLDVSGRQPLQFYLAKIDGEPAGIAELFMGGRAAGLYSLGVAPRFRGRGIGTALVLTPLLVARTHGYDLGVVEPADESLPMFEHLGFEQTVHPPYGYRIA